MKKLILALALVVGLTTLAQEKRGPIGAGDKLTPEQRTEKHLEKMTKDLSLNETQKNQIKELLVKGADERKAHQEERKERKANGVKPTVEEREAFKAKMEEKRDFMNAEMKKILTPEQFVKWEEKKEDRKEKVAKKMEERNKKRKK